MNTLIVGTDVKSGNILEAALRKRRHTVQRIAPSDKTVDEIQVLTTPLIFLSESSNATLSFSRNLRSGKAGDVYTIIAVLDKENISNFDEVLKSGVDQCIIESLYDEQRLDIRLSLAEKQANSHIQRSITEQKLRESEARYRSTLETTVDAIITINDRGEIKTFNQAAEKLFRYDTSEVIGRNVKILMPEPYKREHDDYIHNYLETGHRKIIGIGRIVTGRKKDGSTFPIYLAVSEVGLPDQRIFTGIVRDMTEQRRLEQEVLRISEYERRRIGQDLHDGLGQMLTGIGLISKNIGTQLQKDNHKLADQAEEVTKLIREADQYARELARGLVPVEFDADGLTAAIERLTAQAQKLFNIECRLQASGKLHFEDATNVTHLYRIAQEAISNAVKHGNASKVEIQLVGSEDHVRLRVSDNGSGFESDWDKKGGLGVRIMQFRASLIGANLEVSDSAAGGALLTCTMPILG